MTVVICVGIIMLEFEWDENKNQENIRKHGVSFQEASRIFSRPTLDAVDERKDYGETRIASVGKSKSKVLYVVHTWRGHVIRIISARKANQNEQRAYRQIYRQGN